ncbi:AraC family transcriptional regulator [Chromobacterium sp. ATCC 53434]|uniref:helix-turn-helix transcriptional regulator n=1 Tax=Chromobacterium sp. (strain ATCC 53434 / SC 14030) TaxID=2059672 RepID=UPI000C7770C8|nr:AraC family transcriptional regulator [Chromobacterium sp. ATCC 53434]AUH49917.1 AraC family transcriptional regulator [Chromobacterium sp. ATCC 53434]
MERVIIAGLSVAALRRGVGDYTARHVHSVGQLAWASEGALELEADDRRVLLPAGCVGWIPPGMPHGARYHGELRGWSLQLGLDGMAALPPELGVWRASPLLQGVFLRLGAWPTSADDEAARRLVAVLADELTWAEPYPASLAWPAHPALRKLAEALLGDPSRDWDLQRWADHIGMSRRSLIRHFRAETGMGVAEWRERLRMLRARALLAEGRSVSYCAAELAYASSSAFIVAFRRCFGETPGRYLSA